MVPRRNIYGENGMNADGANCVRCGIDSGGIDRARGIAHGEYGVYEKTFFFGDVVIVTNFFYISYIRVNVPTTLYYRIFTGVYSYHYIYYRTVGRTLEYGLDSDGSASE
jgi:hypothetical protein